MAPPSSPIIVKVPVSAIKAGDNDRKHFDPDALGELAASIAVNGLLEHPVVRPLGNDQYELVAGERRFRAVILLGWSELDVVVREMSDEQAAEAMLAENFHRVNLSPIEEAGAYQKWSAMFGWSNAEIAKRANASEARVASRLRLLSLIPELQFLVNAGELPIGYAAQIVALDPNRQSQILRVVRDNPSIARDAFKAVADELFRQQSVEPLFAMAVEEFHLVDAAAAIEKPVSRKQALNLIDRLAAALADFDPSNPLVAEAARAVDLEAKKVSDAARKANVTRRKVPVAA